MLCCHLICVSKSVLGEVILDNQPILKHYRKAKIQINPGFRGCKLYWQLWLVGEKMADRQKVCFGSSTG